MKKKQAKNRSAAKPAIVAILGGAIAVGSVYAAPIVAGMLEPAAVQAQGEVVPTPPVLVARITPEGFDFKSTELAAGDYLISVHNGTGLEEPLSIVVAETQRGALASRNIAVGADTTFLATLSPGTYTITEANHPSWVATVEITP